MTKKNGAGRPVTKPKTLARQAAEAAMPEHIKARIKARGGKSTDAFQAVVKSMNKQWQALRVRGITPDHFDAIAAEESGAALAGDQLKRARRAIEDFDRFKKKRLEGSKDGGHATKATALPWQQIARAKAAEYRRKKPGISNTECAIRILANWPDPSIKPPSLHTLRLALPALEQKVDQGL